MKKMVMKLLACLCITTLSLGPISVMAATDVEIENPTPDLEAPILKSVSISSQELTPTNSVKISAEVEDELSGVSQVRVVYKKPNGATMGVYLTLNASTKMYEGTLSVGANDIAGTWEVSYMTLTDKKDNTRNVYHTTAATTNHNQFDFSECKLNVSGMEVNTDKEAPILRDISIKSKIVKPNEKIQVSAEVTDNDKGVSIVRATYKKPSGKTFGINLSLNSSTGRYEGSYTVGQYDELGTWKLESVYVTDKGNNSATIKTYTDAAGTSQSLTHCDVEVVETTPDSIAPVLKDIYVTADVVEPSQKIEIIAKAEDNLSGISSMSVTYKKPKGGSQNISLRATGNPGEYSGSYTVNQYDEFGTWTLQSVYLNDKNANSVTVRSYVDENGETKTLEHCNVEVTKTTPDYEAPILKHLSIWTEQINSQQVNVKLEATAIDYLSNVNSISLVYKKPSGRNINVSMSKTSENKFLGTIAIDKYDELGTWTLQSVTARDTRGNSKIYAYINEANDFQNYDINVYGKITLAPSIPMSITVDPYQIEMATGDKKQLAATLNYSRGETEVITTNALTKYASSNTDLVKVSSTGQITCVGTKAGNAIVEVSYGRIKANVMVTVNEGSVEPYLNISPLSTVLSPGQEQQIKVEEMIGTIPTDVTKSNDITYKSLSPDKVTVTSSGLIQVPANAPIGKATIEVAYKDLVGQIQVEVSKPTVKSLVISPTEETIKYGESLQLSVKALMSDGTVKDITTGDDKATFKSSNVELATVNEDGLVEALPTAKSGVVKVTATYNSQRVTSTITINGVPEITSITVEPENTEVEIGGTQQLTVKGLLTDGTTQDITASSNKTNYRTSNSAIATVDTEGNVTVKETATEGQKVTITATHNGFTGKAIITVKDSRVKLIGIEVPESNLEIEQGKTHQLIVNAVYSDGTKEEVTASTNGTTYRSNSVSLATVDAEGLITVKENATIGKKAVIKVAYKGFVQDVPVKVKEASVKLTGIELNKTSISLKEGQTYDIKVNALYSDGTVEDVTLNSDLTTYKSNNTEIATVDSNGRVSIVAGAPIGRLTNIVVNYKGHTAKLSVDVDGVVLTGIEAEETKLKLEADQSHQLKIYAVYSDGTREDITTNGAMYRCGNKSIADVTDSGLITLKSTATVGSSTTVTATYQGYSTKITVTASGKVVTGIETSETAISVKQGESHNLTVYAIYDDGSKEDITADAKYRASNDYATVDENGRITVADTTAVGQKTTITVTYGSHTLKVVVTADGVVATSIEAEETEVEVEQGKTHDIKLNAIMSDGSVEAIEPTDATYRTSSATVATVDSNGRVTVKETAKVGATCTITATYNGLTTKITITVLESSYKVVGLEVGDSTIYVEAGKSHDLTVYAIYNDGSKVDVTTDGTTYRTGNSTIATVDTNGVVTVKPTAAVGKQTTITIISKGVTEKVTLVVDGVVTESISLAETTVTVGRGQSYQASVQAIYSDGTQADVTTSGATYRTGNSAIATVDANGVVTVKETATVGARTTLIATYDGYSEKMSIVVGE